VGGREGAEEDEGVEEKLTKGSIRAGEDRRERIDGGRSLGRTYNGG
jgi:hypothetical protein